MNIVNYVLNGTVSRDFIGYRCYGRTEQNKKKNDGF